MRSWLAVILLAVGCAEAPPPGPPPVADLSEEITGGAGPFLASASGLLVPDGWTLRELVASGTATDYRQAAALTDDGRWSFVPSTTAEYRTRVIVRAPSDPADASGVVIVEWLNVSGGADADPVFAYLREELVRQGHAWVGVSAQQVGVEGGESLFTDLPATGLVGTDPERYGTLTHPGDGYSFDVFTQVARALREGAGLGGIVPHTLIAAGESQSAFALTTYYDGVQPLTHAFDGFFVHSRAAGALPLVRPGESVELGSVIVARVRPIFRDDLEAPVMCLQAEGDLVGYLSSARARQNDGATFRLWEVAGTAHADAHLLGEAASMFECGVPVNDGPMHVVAKAALRSLVDWTVDGVAPPEAPRLEMIDDEIARDADGIALGGIRTPPVDVPIDVLSGETSSTDIACGLFGSTQPLPEARLAELYTSAADYEMQFSTSADATIAAGFALEDDRAALMAYADPTRIAP